MTTSAMPELPDAAPARAWNDPAAVRLAHRVESTSALDGLGNVVAVASRAVGADGSLGNFLRGAGTGHALHPFLTDLPIGFWTSASVLDILGGRRSRPAAQLLTGLGIASTVPTVVTGLAEWHELRRPESRVGTVHAVLNSVALTGYVWSYSLRRKGRHGAGALAALGAMTVATAAGYLGGHLTSVRKAGSRDTAYDTDGVGPALSRPGSGAPLG
jgi:uncharacterized membrane protein